MGIPSYSVGRPEEPCESARSVGSYNRHALPRANWEVGDYVKSCVKMQVKVAIYSGLAIG